MIRTAPVGEVFKYFHRLSIIVNIVRQHIRNYLPEIFELIQQYWTPQYSNQETIVALIEAIAEALDNQFKVYLPMLLTNLLQIFDVDISEQRQVTLRALKAMPKIGANLEEYLHLVIPAIIRLFENPAIPDGVRIEAIRTLGLLSKQINFSEYASRIIHPLARALKQSQPEVRQAAMDSLYMLVYQLTTEFVVFIPLIHKNMQQHRLHHPNYEMVISKLLRNEPLPISELKNESLER
jgi:FKBP12-rapamycin complex-associated protein